MVEVIFVYVDTVYGFCGYSFSCLVGCFKHDYLDTCCFECLIFCVLYFCICTCSVQLSMFHMERRARNTLTILQSSSRAKT